MRTLVLKSILFIAVSTLLIHVQADDDSEESKTTVMLCIEESKIDMDTMAKIKSGTTDVEDPVLNKFGYCMLDKMGMVNEDGIFDRKKLMDDTDEEDKAEMKGIMEKCLSNVEPITDENAWQLFKCYSNEKPNDVVF